jgi:hypothetical protein
MKQSEPPEPFTKTELSKLIKATTLTQVAKIALKVGNTPEDLLDAALESQYTRQGVYAAVRAAGHRMRKERSDKGQTLKLKINKLIEQANALQAKLQGEAGVKQV